jgi:hypothetical protein
MWLYCYIDQFDLQALEAQLDVLNITICRQRAETEVQYFSKWCVLGFSYWDKPFVPYSVPLGINTMFKVNAMLSVCLSVCRLQGSERDRRLPSQSSHGGAGLQAGPLGAILLWEQTSNLPLVSNHVNTCIYDDLYRIPSDDVESGCQISDCNMHKIVYNNNNILVDKELVEERKKLYEAIGYSENAKLATYSAEVCMA